MSWMLWRSSRSWVTSSGPDSALQSQGSPADRCRKLSEDADKRQPWVCKRIDRALAVVISADLCSGIGLTSRHSELTAFDGMLLCDILHRGRRPLALYSHGKVQRNLTQRISGQGADQQILHHPLEFNRRWYQHPSRISLCTSREPRSAWFNRCNLHSSGCTSVKRPEPAPIPAPVPAQNCRHG